MFIKWEFDSESWTPCDDQLHVNEVELTSYIDGECLTGSVRASE